MNAHELKVWIEAHPGESVVIGGVSLIFLLWLFGFFSSSGTQSSGDPLAAAYYAAEAQQAVVGGQIQQATIAAQASTAQTLIQANTAATINSQNVGAATTINQQQVAGAENVAQTQANTITTLGNYQLQATQSNNTTLAQIINSNNQLAQHVNDTAAVAHEFDTVAGLIPTELAYTGGGAVGFTLPNGFNAAFGPEGGVTPKGAAQAGFTPDQIAQMFSRIGAQSPWIYQGSASA